MGELCHMCLPLANFSATLNPRLRAREQGSRGRIFIRIVPYFSVVKVPVPLYMAEKRVRAAGDKA